MLFSRLKRSNRNQMLSILKEYENNEFEKDFVSLFL